MQGIEEAEVCFIVNKDVIDSFEAELGRSLLFANKYDALNASTFISKCNKLSVNDSSFIGSIKKV